MSSEDKDIRKVIWDLDALARDVDHYEYGLPISEGPVARMTEILKRFRDAALAPVSARAVELATVLAKIQAWEMLNPPRVDLLPELGWLKAVVMKVNLGPTAEVPGGQPNES